MNKWDVQKTKLKGKTNAEAEKIINDNDPSNDSDDIPEELEPWRIELADEENIYTEDEHSYYIGLMKLTKFDKSVLALKPAKASSLKGKEFILSVSDFDGEYYSSIKVEVAEW